MELNTRIAREIAERLKRARENIPELPDEMKPILEYYDSQSVQAPALSLVPELTSSFEVWPRDVPMQAAGFEWFFDGGDVPEALGYAYDLVKTHPNPAGEPIGGDTHRARDDFDGGVEFGSMLFGDSGGFDVARMCFPLYECYMTGMQDEADDEWDALINLFTLRMLHCLHIALARAVSAPSFQALKLMKPFYFFANNHDWSPFLVFAYDGEPVEGPEYELGESVGIEVPRMAAWVDGVLRRNQEQESREDRIRAAGKASPGELEKILLGLPELNDGRGEPLALSQKELKGFASQTLSQEQYYEAISFEAFAHLLGLVLAGRGADLYDIHGAMIFLFLNDGDRALEWTRAYLAQKPKKFQKKKEALLDCAKNSIRWAGDGPEHRWPNPNLALSKSPSALKSMGELLK